MSDFFDTIGKRISDTVDDLGKKAGDTIDIQKKKNEIYGLKRDSERDMTEIGRLVYERFKQGEVVDTDFIALCEAIEKREEQTEASLTFSSVYFLIPRSHPATKAPVKMLRISIIILL